MDNEHRDGDSVIDQLIREELSRSADPRDEPPPQPASVPENAPSALVRNDLEKTDRYLIGMVVVGIVTVVVISLISFFTFRQSDQTASPTSVNYGEDASPAHSSANVDAGQGIEPLRPERWYQDTRVSAHPSAEDESRFQRMISEPVFRAPTRGDPIPADSILSARIHIAQLTIGLVENVPHAWQWDRVRRAVARFDRGIRIRQSYRQDAIMAWNGRDLVINPRQLRSTTDEELQSTLIHEATHVAYDEVVSEQTGYSDLQLLRVYGNCIDLAVLDDFVTETLAFSNQAAWLFRDRPPTHDYRDGRLRTVPLANNSAGWERLNEEHYCALLGDHDCMWVLAKVVYQYALHEVAGQAMGNHTYQLCGPIPILDGPNRGGWFYPTDPAPQVVPLRNLLDEF